MTPTVPRLKTKTDKFSVLSEIYGYGYFWVLAASVSLFVFCCSFASLSLSCSRFVLGLGLFGLSTLFRSLQVRLLSFYPIGTLGSPFRMVFGSVGSSQSSSPGCLLGTLRGLVVLVWWVSFSVSVVTALFFLVSLCIFLAASSLAPVSSVAALQAFGFRSPFGSRFISDPVGLGLLVLPWFSQLWFQSISHNIVFGNLSRLDFGCARSPWSSGFGGALCVAGVSGLEVWVVTILALVVVVVFG